MRNAAILFVLVLSMACGGDDSATGTTEAVPPPTPTAATPASPANSIPADSVPGTPTEPPVAFEATALPDYAIDDAIPANVRDALYAVQNRLLDGVRANDPMILDEVFAPGVTGQSAQEIRTLFEALRKVVVDARVEPWHDVYVEPKTGAPIFVETGGPNNVRIALPGAGPKVYTSLQQLRGEFRDGLLGAVYVNNGEGWRLITLRVGALRLNGLNSHEWYAEAKELADNGQRLPAWLRLAVAEDLLESVPFVAYPHTKDARQLKTRLGEELAAENKFPLALATIAASPRVVRIDPTFLQGSLSPAVHYVTKLSLQDSQLGTEAQAVADALAELYPGFCHGATRVAVAAYNQVPVDPKRKYPSAAFAANCP